MSIVEWGKKVLGVGDAVGSAALAVEPSRKYRCYNEIFSVDLPDRRWPQNIVKQAPRWCSVDLRDGNQALINPMTLDQKLELWQLLVEVGFKEIEIGFPSAAAVEFDFARTLIENGMIPDDVTPQVLVQARPHLLDRTFAALDGAKRAIVHVYNSTSELQRRVVFNMDRPQIVELIIKGVEQIKTLAANSSTEVVLEYSPESFTGTELDFALEICEAVIGVWGPSPDQPMIINLPATVEMYSPNIYADQVELFGRKIKNRDSIVISLHPHNDRGTGVAAAELALMAGADRVEGTLFGNGERTGNVDIVTLALNLFSQGVAPGLDFSDMPRVRRLYERCTDMPVPPRHPYAGDLVFTAFSGSHQDAIRKGKQAMQKSRTGYWEVPYLPIDPADVGRKYEPLIRINSQSGKGGVAYVMETEFGFALPKKMQPEFSAIIQKISDSTGLEVSPDQIWEAFSGNYLEIKQPFGFVRFRSENREGADGVENVHGFLTVAHNGADKTYEGSGNGPIDACKAALLTAGVTDFRLCDFVEHALSAGSDAEAAAYIQIETADGRRLYGVGRDANTTKANIKALLCAVNRAAL